MDSVLDQCHHRCRELVITPQQIYGPGQSQLLSPPPLAPAAEGFHLLFLMFSLLLRAWLRTCRGFSSFPYVFSLASGLAVDLTRVAVCVVSVMTMMTDILETVRSRQRKAVIQHANNMQTTCKQPEVLPSSSTQLSNYYCSPVNEYSPPIMLSVPVSTTWLPMIHANYI